MAQASTSQYDATSSSTSSPGVKRSRSMSPRTSTYPSMMPQVGSIWDSKEELMMASLRAANEAGYNLKLKHVQKNRITFKCGRKKSGRSKCFAQLDIVPVEDVDGRWQVDKLLKEHDHPSLGYDLEDWKDEEFLMKTYKEETRAAGKMAKSEWRVKSVSLPLPKGERRKLLAAKAAAKAEATSSPSLNPRPASFTPIPSLSTASPPATGTSATTSSTHPTNPSASASTSASAPHPEALSIADLEAIFFTLHPVLVALAAPLHKQGLNSHSRLLIFLDAPGRFLEEAEVGNMVLRLVMVKELEKVKVQLEWEESGR